MSQPTETRAFYVKNEHYAWGYTLYVDTKCIMTLHRLKQIIADRFINDFPIMQDEPFQLYANSKEITNDDDVITKLFEPPSQRSTWIIFKMNKPPHLSFPTDNLIWSRIKDGPHEIRKNGYCPNCRKVWRSISRRSKHALLHIEKHHQEVWKYYTFSIPYFHLHFIRTIIINDIYMYIYFI